MSAEMKHTPGPWGDPDKTVICRGLTFIAHAHYETEEGRANARLIAAAPELLEALLDCRRALEIANFSQELAVVDAAIAKATGATP